MVGKLLVFLALLSGCASTLPPLSCPASGGPSWRELRTSHLVLRTDLDEQSARKLIIQAEQDYDLLEQVLRSEIGGDPPRPVQEVRLTVFQRETDLHALHPLAAGFYNEASNGWEPWPAITTYDSGRLHTGGLLRHELTHRLVAHYLPTAPPWVNEGLAEVLSTVRRSGSQIEIGGWDPDLYKYGTNAMPDVYEVMRGTYPKFTEQPSYYTEASGLVHLLQSEKKGHRAQWLAYVRWLAAGLRHDVAWTRAFRGVSPGNLENELNGYRFITLRVDTRAIEASEPVEPSPEMRPMREGEVHLLWVELRHWRDHDAVEHDLREAARDLGETPELLSWSALHDLKHHRRPESINKIARAIQAAPDRPEYLLAAEQLGGNPAAADLARVAKTGEQLAGAARLEWRRHNDQDASALFARAVIAAPGNWVLWYTAAEAAGQAGRFGDAAMVMSRAWALQPGCSDCAVKLRNWVAFVDAKNPGAPLAGIDLEPPPRQVRWGLDVTTRVLDEEGRPVPATVVAIVRDQWDTTHTDGDGTVHLKVPAALAILVVLPDNRALLADRFYYQLHPSPKPVTLTPLRVAMGQVVHQRVVDGIDPANIDGQARVNSVDPASPAGRMGIHSGDALLAIGGHDVRTLGPEAINRLLAGFDEGPLDLVIQPKGQTARQVRLEPPGSNQI